MTRRRERQLVLGAMFRSLGAFPSGWRHPKAHADPLNDPAVMAQTARSAEAAGLDYLFFGDWLATGPELEHTDPYLLARIEPLTAISYLAAITSRIGLIATANTSYSDPYTLARLTASIDRLSAGRAGINLAIGTEPRATANHGRAARWENEQGFDSANEFVEVLRLLWDSWEDDAFISDKRTGRLIAPEGLHAPSYIGDHHIVHGALNVPRPVQGQLPIVHAGTSPRSRRFAAQHADVALVSHPTLAEAVRFHAEMQDRLRAAARSGALSIVTPVLPIVGETVEAAWGIYDQLVALVPLYGDAASESLPVGRDLRAVAGVTGVPVGRHGFDDAVPAALADRFSDPGQRLLHLVQSRSGRTIGGDRPVTYRHVLVASIVHQTVVVGTPRLVADHFQTWFEARAVDGFAVLSPFLGGQFEAFTRGVVPELVRRGLFRDGYEGSTLRDHLGLGRPENHYRRPGLAEQNASQQTPQQRRTV